MQPVILALDAKAILALDGIPRAIRMGMAPAGKMSNIFFEVFVYLCVGLLYI